ncbi:hypothetical protein [Arthrobacter ramosus]|uniref:Uncharacterized protein n=1 Tax=Arthrobacter ramosus TaxID=1672 RepID=A0ABV5Y379_ARTRM|nr:hypothetical protein [Arthrobacter ramosus]
MSADDGQALIVDVPGVRRAVKASILGTMALLFECTNEPGKTLDLLRHAYEAASELLPEPLPVAPVAHTSKGAVAIIDELWDIKRALLVLNAIAADLRSSGAEGRLGPWKQPRIGKGAPESEDRCITAALSPVGTQWLKPAPAGRPRWGGDLRWRIEDGTLERILDHALSWCQVDGATSFFQVALNRTICLPDERRGLFAAAYASVGAASFICYKDSNNVRKVDFSNEGYVLYSMRNTSLPREQVASSLGGVLADLADDLQYGLVKVSNWTVSTFKQVLAHGWRDHNDDAFNSIEYAHPLLDHLVPGPYGIQLLGPLHDKQSFPPDWQLSPAGTDRVLAVHPDADAWFSQDRPDPEYVASGRESLGKILFTDELGLQLMRASYE